jgi:hypothetical protein
VPRGSHGQEKRGPFDQENGRVRNGLNQAYVSLGQRADRVRRPDRADRCEDLPIMRTAAVAQGLVEMMPRRMAKLKTTERSLTTTQDSTSEWRELRAQVKPSRLRPKLSPPFRDRMVDHLDRAVVVPAGEIVVNLIPSPCDHDSRGGFPNRLKSDSP